MSLLPYFGRNEKLIDGSLYHLLPFCKRHFLSEKCKSHYLKLQNESSGCYRCPYGLSSYVYTTPTGNIIFTGLRINGVYDKKLSKVTESKEYIYNPHIDPGVCGIIAREDAASMYDKSMYENKINSINNLLHDARSLNQQITKNSNFDFWDSGICINTDSEEVMIKALKNTNISSYLISQIFLDLDAILNPSLANGKVKVINVFKKFDKLRMLLAGYMGKKVWIELIPPKDGAGNNIKVEYEYTVNNHFEKLLFNILENGVKYSPNNQPVQVSFAVESHILRVSIESVGPYCDKDEIDNICEKGFRGKNAQLTNKSGKGLGLSIAKEIASAHNIGLSFDCDSFYKFEGSEYGRFIVKMVFDQRDCPY